MVGHISQIANLLTEDPDIFSEKKENQVTATRKKWESTTTIPYDSFNSALAIIKDVADKNGLTFDWEHALKSPDLNDANVAIEVRLTANNKKAKETLARKLAQTMGDSHILADFDDNLHANLLTAISGELNDRLKDEKSLGATFSLKVLPPGAAEGADRAEAIPTMTLNKVQVKVEPPEPSPEDMGGMPGPEDAPMPAEPDLGMGGMPGGGGLGGPGMGMDMGMDMEPMPEEMPLGDEEPGGGGMEPMPEEMPLGDEEPGGPAEEGASPEDIKNAATIDLAHIDRIANLITEDPDILSNECW